MQGFIFNNKIVDLIIFCFSNTFVSELCLVKDVMIVRSQLQGFNKSHNYIIMNIDFSCIESIKKAGFTGFETIESLWKSNKSIPKEKGVYLVLRVGTHPCEYLDQGTGGFFKGKNPNIGLLELQSNWLEKPKAMYIGKAGSPTGGATLFSRLNQYLKFGQGKNIGHWGGRLIWQLKDASQLVVCWKAFPNDDPRAIEKALLQNFIIEYGKRPFAN